MMEIKSAHDHVSLYYDNVKIAHLRMEEGGVVAILTTTNHSIAIPVELLPALTEAIQKFWLVQSGNGGPFYFHGRPFPDGETAVDPDPPAKRRRYLVEFNTADGVMSRQIEADWVTLGDGGDVQFWVDGRYVGLFFNVCMVREVGDAQRS